MQAIDTKLKSLTSASVLYRQTLLKNIHGKVLQMKSSDNKKSGKLISATFINCLKEKPLNKISVKEVCEKAGFNRTTFYDNFRSINELMYTLQLDYFLKIYEEIKESLAPGGKFLPEDKEKNMLRVVNYHQENREYFLLLMQNNISGIFETNIARDLKKIILPAGYSKLEEYEFIYNFMGNLAAVISWLIDGMPVSAEEFAALLAQSF